VSSTHILKILFSLLVRCPNERESKIAQRTWVGFTPFRSTYHIYVIFFHFLCLQNVTVVTIIAVRPRSKGRELTPLSLSILHLSPTAFIILIILLVLIQPSNHPILLVIYLKTHKSIILFLILLPHPTHFVSDIS
jgi:hypothetical protein